MKRVFIATVAMLLVLEAYSAPQYYQPQQYLQQSRYYQPRIYYEPPQWHYPSSTPKPYYPVEQRYYPTATISTPLASPAHTADANAPIVRYDSDSSSDGSYSYGYQTGNGIAVAESGAPKVIGANVGATAQGSYSYISPEGIPVSITYIADENGFRAVGDAIPTAPPVPPAIQRALDYIAARQSKRI